MREFLWITKALSDQNRLRALMLLADGELCVCQIIEMLDLAASTVSKHMTVLKQAGLVQSRKQGRWIYYRLADEDASDQVKQTHLWLFESLAGDKRILADAKHLKAVRRMKVEELCKHYRS